MVGKPRVLALIPARGGSKSIPGKNIRPLAGIPLLAYSVAAGRKAALVDRVLVSTDDAAIAETAGRFGAEVPFSRPAELAQDDTLDLPVFRHALAWLDEHEGYRPDLVVHLRPTSPIRPPGLVDGAIRLLWGEKRADSLRGVVRAGQNPYKMWRIVRGRLRPILTRPREAYNAPRQRLPDIYWQTGHIDVLRPSRTIARRSMSGKVILPWIVEADYSVDIDSSRDWERAEEIVRSSRLEFVRP